jgi:hypothetical protein
MSEKNIEMTFKELPIGAWFKVRRWLAVSGDSVILPLDPYPPALKLSKHSFAEYESSRRWEVKHCPGEMLSWTCVLFEEPKLDEDRNPLSLADAPCPPTKPAKKKVKNPKPRGIGAVKPGTWFRLDDSVYGDLVPPAYKATESRCFVQEDGSGEWKQFSPSNELVVYPCRPPSAKYLKKNKTCLTSIVLGFRKVIEEQEALAKEQADFVDRWAEII